MGSAVRGPLRRSWGGLSGYCLRSQVVWETAFVGMAPRGRLGMVSVGGGHPSQRPAAPRLDLQHAAVIEGEDGSGLSPRCWVTSAIAVVCTHSR